MAKKTNKQTRTQVEDYSMQTEYSRTKLPTGEYSGIASEMLIGRDAPTVEYDYCDRADLTEEFAQRDKDLDPQYIWRGKIKSDLNRLVIKAPIIYQQEKIFPRMLIEEMKRHTAQRRGVFDPQMTFATLSEDFDPNAQPGFYNHEEGWKNRMILGDSLQVMASLAENESLRGKVQMIYFDPPYGIKFNSNWQPSTKSTNVKDGSVQDITREPEMVKAFRDTWHDGIHSYLGYLRDRLIVARDLLTESGSCFVQISDENVHKVRAVMDEVFGEGNFVSQISVEKTSGTSTVTLATLNDYVIWYAKNKNIVKYRQPYRIKELGQEGATQYIWLDIDGAEKRLDKFNHDNLPPNGRAFAADNCTSMGKANIDQPFRYQGRLFKPSANAHWKPTYPVGMQTLGTAGRLKVIGNSLMYKRFYDDFPVIPLSNIWNDTKMTGFTERKIYVVQTAASTIQRCMLMTTDPGDLVLDPTCGSGTTAYVAEQWGRRWITIDTSRVSLALARRRLMTAKFPYYLLADSQDGLTKEGEVTGKILMRQTYGKVSQGFVYERVPHITLKSIANNPEIDVIWDKYVAETQRLREALQATGAFKTVPEEWEVPFDADAKWSDGMKKLHAEFMALKRSRQAEMDQSIARTAETEYLYDKPYEDKKKVRVAGPFTVESVAPVRALIAREDGDPIDPVTKIAKDIDYGNGSNYVSRMLRILAKSGVKQAKKGDRISFSSLTPYYAITTQSDGGHRHHIHAAAWSQVDENSPNTKSRKYAIYIGPEFGSVTRLDQNAAVRQAREDGFDILLICAFNYEAFVEEGNNNALGMQVLHARMNSDLHMSTDLKDTANGNPFVIFGEPEIEINHLEDATLTVEIKSVYVYDPKSDEVRCDDADAIDCWMLDTAYNEEAFFARQVYFPGKDKVFDAFKKFMKNDIDEEEWEAVSKTVSLPFARPVNGLIAVKVINHFGDEVMKIFKV